MSISPKPEPQTIAPAARSLRASLAGAKLRKHADFQRAYAAAGRKRRSPSMSWFVAPQSEPAGARVGLTVGKVIGKAHERNRIKRRLRDVLRQHIELLPGGCDLILHPHRTVLTMDFAKLEAEILRILQQANAEQVRANRATPEHSRSTETA